MITEDYVSFEIAKLLKERGFEVPSFNYEDWLFCMYDEDGKINYGCFSEDWYPRITLQMAMKWLREVHNIHIAFTWCSSYHGNNLFSYHIDKMNDVAYNGYDSDEEYVYEEACDAAIKYCLKNLIKNEDKEEESEIPIPKTVDEAISTLEKILSDEDRDYLLENGAISMHNSLGRWIRNEWGLWTGSELKDELMNMNKGLNHPDDMSNYIIEEFIKYWNNKL